jgi:HAE1 family hydrophobic/amphiphilic exporter-1
MRAHHRPRPRLARAAGAALLAAALGLGAGPAPAPASAAGPAAPSPSGLTLTVDDVRRIALANGREIRKAEQYGAGVRGRYLEERAVAFPQLTFSSYYSYRDDKSVFLGPERTDTLGAAATVTQPLYTWGRIGAALRAADVGLATATDRLRQAQQGTLRDALGAWYDALLADELRSIAAENLAQKERILDESRRRLEAGTATDYDVLSASVAVQNARPAVIRAETLVGTARERLRFLLALGEGTALELRGSLEAPAAPPPSYEAAVAEARHRRPDLAELRNRKRVAEEVVTIQRAGDKPRLDFQGTAGWQQVTAPGFDGSGPLWAAGLSFSWPLFDGQRTKGLVMEAESEAAASGIAERELFDSIAVDARNAVDDVTVASGIVDALDGTVSQAQRLLAMAEKGYQLGVKTRLDVNDAQLNLLQARGNLARARRDLLAARTQLAWVTGSLE